MTIFYQSLRELEIDEHLISGLIQALNQFTVMQFNQPIESIEMGGFRWIYIIDEKSNLLFVLADSKDLSADILRARLDVIKRTFIKTYVTERGLLDGTWQGDLSSFDPFQIIVADFYLQWTKAQDILSSAEFFDMLGIFQQLFNFLRNIIEGHIFSEKKGKIYNNIQNLYENFIEQHDYDEYTELNKIIYTRETGFNLLNINPTRCDALTFKKFVITLLAGIIGILKMEIGFDQCLILFSDEGIIEYIYSNFILLKSLKLDIIIFELFFLK
ncbi:MAG: hypothetical protein ACTSR8_13020 [Promethearchaeota archaeon]